MTIGEWLTLAGLLVTVSGGIFVFGKSSAALEMFGKKIEDMNDKFSEQFDKIDKRLEHLDDKFGDTRDRVTRLETLNDKYPRWNNSSTGSGR